MSLAPEEPAPAARPRGAAAPFGAELQRVADEILQRVSLVSLPAELTLQLQLEVPLLRGVRVELRVKEGRLRTALRADDRRGFDRLRAAVPELEAALEERGLAADRVVVELGPSR